MTVEALSVWLRDERVGVIRRDPRGFVFDASQRAGSLTAAAQGSTGTWPREFAQNWFDNLLPEGLLRQAVADRLGLAPSDTFGLLAEIGWECAGAVAVLPDERRPGGGAYRPLKQSELWARLDALPFLLAEDEDDVHMSLGGAQEKLLLFRDAVGWHLPLDGAVSTHILKPEPRQYEGLAVAEAFCLAAASEATRTAKAEVLTEAGHRPTLVVTRFDREEQDGTILRIHQEDGCQLLGLPASARFATAQPSPARASYGAIAKVLMRRAADPAADAVRLLEQMTVNLALGNHDAHGKNYSVLHQGSAITLAPLYDVSPTRPFTLAAYDRVARHSAMLVDGRRVFDTITRGSLQREAQGWGVPPKVGRLTVETTLERLAGGIGAAKRRYPDVPSSVLAAIEENLARVSTSDW